MCSSFALLIGMSVTHCLSLPLSAFPLTCTRTFFFLFYSLHALIRGLPAAGRLQLCHAVFSIFFLSLLFLCLHFVFQRGITGQFHSASSMEPAQFTELPSRQIEQLTAWIERGTDRISDQMAQFSCHIQVTE